MGWGTSNGSKSRSQNHSVNVGEKLTFAGDVSEMRSYGGKQETTEEVYVDVGSFSNLAVNGQSGSSVVSAHNLIEQDTDFCRAQKTTITALTAVTTTTTTTGT